MKKLTVIFDMDGVIVDNTEYHVKAWDTFLKKRGFQVSRKEIEDFQGRINTEIYRHYFGSEITMSMIRKYAKEKEGLYMSLYRSKIKPVAGLRFFLQTLRHHKLPIGLATAAPPQNVRFTLRHTGLKKFFHKIINSSHVARGKPHPDIYLLAAKELHARPERCVAFEDTRIGVLSAKRAGMKVVGVTTTHAKRELKRADWIIKDFRGLSIEKLIAGFPPARE